MSFDKPVAPAILLFYGYYSPVFETRYQGPEGESKQDPRQKKLSLATPRADPTSSGDQDNLSSPPSPGSCPPDGSPELREQGIPEHGSKSAEPGSSTSP